MGFIKKNLIFTIIMAVCILAFAAGAYFAFAESGKIDQKKQKITSAESQLKSNCYSDVGIQKRISDATSHCAATYNNHMVQRL